LFNLLLLQKLLGCSLLLLGKSCLIDACDITLLQLGPEQSVATAPGFTL